MATSIQRTRDLLDFLHGTMQRLSYTLSSTEQATRRLEVLLGEEVQKELVSKHNSLPQTPAFRLRLKLLELQLDEVTSTVSTDVRYISEEIHKLVRCRTTRHSTPDSKEEAQS